MPLLAGLGPIGVPELLIIAFIILLIFGVGRLPEVFGGLGRGIREFRKESAAEDTTTNATSGPADLTAPPSDVPAAGSVFCEECGGRNSSSAKFCASCGHRLAAGVN